jgi:hypothetical protein
MSLKQHQSIGHRRAFRHMQLALLAVLLAGASVEVGGPAAASAPRLAGLIPSTFTEVYSQGETPIGSARSANASCAAGQAAVGVGALGAVPLGSITPGPDAASVQALTAPLPQPDLPWNVIGVVTCAPTTQLAGATFFTREQYHPNGALWSASVDCPAGMRAFGGGGYFRNSNGSQSTSYQRMTTNTVAGGGKRWKVEAVNPNPEDTLVVATHCAYASSSTKIHELSIPVISTPGTAGYTANTYVRCEPGYLPISGGVSVDSPAGSSIEASLPVRSGQIGWFGKANSIDPSARLHVIVLCGTG